MGDCCGDRRTTLYEQQTDMGESETVAETMRRRLTSGRRVVEGGEPYERI